MELDVVKQLHAALLRIAQETRDFDPPYIPSRLTQDLGSNGPEDLVRRYTLAPHPTAGFERLWREGRLDLAVENVAWRFRAEFPDEVGVAARQRLEQAGFDVLRQKQT